LFNFAFSGFSLKKFAQRSFGVFREPPNDIVWKFAPAVAEAVIQYQFHPGQSVEKQRDGSVIVRFRAGALMKCVGTSILGVRTSRCWSRQGCESL